MTARPVPWCSIEAATIDGLPLLVVTTFAGDIEIDRVEIGADADPQAIDALPRRLAGRLLFSTTMPVVVRLLADLGIDVAGEIVDTREWEALLWPSEASSDDRPPNERALRIIEEVASLDPATAGRSAQLGQSALPVERRLLATLAGGASLLAGGDEIAFTDARVRPDPLRRIKKGKPVDPSRVSKLIGGERGLAAALAHYERRDEQTAMAVAVAEAIRDGAHVMVEAGTGTGKSLAYLTPSLLHALQTGEQIVVATHTRALQDQLSDRDAPIALDLLRSSGADQQPKVAVLKGRSNYLCLRRWFAAVRQPPATEQEASFLARVNLWVHRTETGDRAEIPLRPVEGSRFSAISAEGEACNASRCIFQQRNRCFLYRARREADAAHLVITNHALLMTDLVEGGAALPSARHLIVDEAHHLEDQATISFSKTLSLSGISVVLDSVEHPARGTAWGLLREIEALLRQVQRHGQLRTDAELCSVAIDAARSTTNAVRLEAVTLFGLLHGVAVDASGRASDYALTVRLTDGVRHSPAWSAIENVWDGLNARIASLHEALSELADFAETLDQPSEDDEEAVESDLQIRFTTAMAALREISALGGEAFLNPEKDKVYWVESGRDSSRASIRFAPLDLASLLQEQLYAKLDSLVLTSATLTSGGSFAYLKSRLGLPDADELALPSPFDFERAAMVCTVSDIPEPKDPGYGEAVHDAIVDIALAANGRTLVLFTSLAAMNAARRAISPILSSAGLTVVTQHEDGSAEQLAERLRSFDRTVVLGTAAFWEGIDVPGPALSALVIVRLPFAVPTDPIVAARGERFDNAFMEYSLPEAILRFRQGFGRLIRRRTDRGVCVVLDSRILSKRYGAAFLRALPRCATMTLERDELGATVADWLDRSI